MKVSRSGRSLYYGPFPSRALCREVRQRLARLFKMRRCIEDLNPDPVFPGCIYSEMKMCLAPCFKGVADAEYEAEVARVQTCSTAMVKLHFVQLSAERDQSFSKFGFRKCCCAAWHALKN